MLRGLCAKDRESDPMAVRLRTMRAALRIADIEASWQQGIMWYIYVYLYNLNYLLLYTIPIFSSNIVVWFLVPVREVECLI